MTCRKLAIQLCAIVILGAHPAAAASLPPQDPNLQQPSARLVLPSDIEGRFFVRNAARELIAEVYKPAGRTLTLNVGAGAYEVRVEREKTILVAKVSIADGAEVMLDRDQLSGITVENVTPPGAAEVMPYAVTSRNRFDFRFGASSHGSNTYVAQGIDSTDLLGGIRYTRYFKENLAATFTIDGGGGQVSEIRTVNGAYDNVSAIVSFPVGVRWNPWKFGRQHDGIKPFVAFSAGPVMGSMVADYHGNWRSGDSVRTSATIGGFVGGGVDFHAGRTCVIGVDAGYRWMADFSEPVGGDDNYSGPTVSINLGFMWGRGSTPTP